jgi:signal transduction histidine kinase/HD-like signal output (HDOD) protein
MPIHNALADQLSNFKHIPTLPHILLQLIKTCNEDNGSLKDVSKIIEKDTALSTRILRLVNSAYYARRDRISSVDGAVGFLGSNAIKNIAICSSVHEVFQTVKSNKGFNLKQFWWHALRCAVLAKLIARNRNFHNPDEAFLSGMLHDIGKIILWVNFPQPYSDLLEMHKGRPEMMLAGESQFGANHAEIGAWLLDRWNFQSFIADAVRYHHHSQSRIRDALPLVKFIYVANALCKNSGRHVIEGLGAAQEIFGFTPAVVKDLLSQADVELKAVAESLGISVEPCISQDSVCLENDREKQIDLIKEVRDRSLLLGTVENLLAATDEAQIWKESFLGLQSLFDLSLVLFFIFDPEKQCLRGVTLPDDKIFSMIKDLIIPLQMEKSLLIECLQTHRIADSFTRSTDIIPAIIDEQIIRLLGREGIACIPMIAYGEKAGAMVLGLDNREFSHLTAQIKSIKMLADQTAVAIRVYHSRRSQLKEIQSERLGASSSMARRVIHEVNNPLGIIKNYLRILGMKLAAADIAQDEIKILNEEIDRVAQILRNLNGTSEDWIRKVEPVDVNAVLSDILKITRESLLNHFNVQLHFDSDPGLPAVLADKSSLKQVFVNLMKNAFEAMPDGGNLHIRTRHVSSRLGGALSDSDHEYPGYVEITISDDGPGIADEIKTRLFEPYASTKRGNHSGLGLSIVHNIIQTLKGTISCESEPGDGTTFRIGLPTAYSDKALLRRQTNELQPENFNRR